MTDAVELPSAFAALGMTLRGWSLQHTERDELF